MSSNPAQTPDCQPQPVTALAASREAAAVRQVDGTNQAGQELNGHAWDVTTTGGGQEATTWVSVRQPATGDQTSLAARVRWSDEAEQNLATVVTAPAVRSRLRSNAEEILHDILPERYYYCVEAGDAGFAGDGMWHRGVAHEYEMLPEQDDGAENYFLLYRRLNSSLEFEVVAVCSIYQVASRWERRSRSSLMRQIRALRRRLPWGLRR